MIPILPTSKSVHTVSLVLSGPIVDARIVLPGTSAREVTILAMPVLQAPALTRASRAAFASQVSTAATDAPLSTHATLALPDMSAVLAPGTARSAAETPTQTVTNARHAHLAMFPIQALPLASPSVKLVLT